LVSVRAKLLILLGALACAGCFRPKLAGESFYCHQNDNPACPDGQTCVDGRCVSPGLEGDGGLEPVDLLPPGAPDDGAISMPPSDLSTPQSMPDLSKPPDLSMCVGPGGSCNYHNNAICCSGYCIYSSETCK
jgi:hypothetical protein